MIHQIHRVRSVLALTLALAAIGAAPALAMPDNFGLPQSASVASMPPAAPDRLRGAEPTIVRLLGDWNNPKPTPHSAIRQAMSIVLA